MEYFWEPKSVQHSLADFIFISGIMVTVATARYTAVQLKTVGQNPAQKEYWQNHRGTRFHHCHHHGCTWTRGMIDFLLILHLPCDEPRVAVNKVSLFEPRNDSLKSFLKCALWFCDFLLLIDFNNTLTKSSTSFTSWVQHMANSVSQIFLPYLDQN